MNKKITAITLLLMALVGFTIASAVSAADWFQPTKKDTSEFGQPKLDIIDKGEIYYPDSPWTEWDDKRVVYQVQRHSKDNKQASIRIEYQYKMKTNNPIYTSNYYWQPSKYKNVYLKNIKKKYLLFWTRNYVRITTTTSINTGSPNYNVKATSSTTKDVRTSITAVQYYWKNKNSLVSIQIR